MNRKFIFKSIVMIAPLISVVSCSKGGVSQKENLNQWNLHVINVLDDATNKDQKDSNGNHYNMVSGVDNIFVGRIIRVDKNGYDLYKDINFITNGAHTDVKGSPRFKFELDNNDWTIDKDGVITSLKENSRVNVTIKVGDKSATTCLVNRNKTNNHKVTNIERSDLNVSGLHIGSSAVSNVTRGLSVGAKNYESINYIYQDSNNNPAGRVNIFSNFYMNNQPDKRVIVDGTYSYIGMLFYLGDAYEGKDFWVRTVWNHDKFQTANNIGDVEPYNFPNTDFNKGSGDSPYVAHKGWNFFEIEKPKNGLMDEVDNYLSLLRIIQLKNSVPNGVDGNTISLCGIFESDDHMNQEDLIKLVEKP